MQTITGSFYSDKLFTMSGGTFTGGTADVRFRDKGFNLNGGTFNSTSNTLFISSSVFNIRSVPGWVHNNCTVNFDSTTSTTLAFGTGANNSVNFYKVIVNKTAPTSANDKLDFAASDTLIVLTDLDIIDGQLINNTAAVKLHGNFTGQSAFTQSNVDFLLVGSGNQTFNLIGASTSAMNGKLIIRKPTASLVTLLNPVTLDAGVGNTLAMEKGIIITTTANLLTIGNDTRCKNLITSSLTYYIEDDNTFVEGPVQKDGNDYFVFPVGNRLTVNGQKAAPISISGTTNNLTDLGGINSFWANYFPVDPANAGYNRNLKDVTLNNIQACEYWMLNRLAGIANAHVWVSYKNAGHSCGPDISADPTKLHVARWDGAKWADHGHGTFRNPSNYHICSNGDVTSFSPFTTASITALIVLPVTLKSFTGMNQDCRAFLQWETALEQNPGNFKIQQSADGINFITAAIVKSKGTAGTYSINLDQPVTTGYYRLEMPDLDGAKKYSDIISVKMNCKKDAENLQVLPNLINKGTILNLKYTVSQVKGLANIVILNEQGSKISRQNITVNNGINLFTVITAGLTPGVYFISIKGQGWQSSVKRVVIK